MEEKRIPKICFREIMRGLKNNSAISWGQDMKTRLENLGLSLRLIEDDTEEGNLIRTIKLAVQIDIEQTFQIDWKRVDSSKF